MKGYLIGWAVGGALAVVIAALVPALGFLGGVLLGFGLSQLGGLIGVLAATR